MKNIDENEEDEGVIWLNGPKSAPPARSSRTAEVVPTMVKPKRKILYVITKANWGGAQRYVYDLATAAAGRGYEVAVVYGEEGLLTTRLKAKGIRTIHASSLGRDVRFGKDFRALHQLRQLFKIERPDIVHLNSSKAGFTGALAARAEHVEKIIFTAHGWAFTEPRSAIVQKVFAVLQYLTVRASTHVIANSEFVRNQTKGWVLPKGRVTLIRLGISEQSYLAREDAREELIKRDSSLAGARDALWIGTIAELHRNKGLDIGIEGWKKAALPGAQWIVLGGGEEEHNLKNQSRDISSIHFLGFIPDAATYMKAFDLFVLPSRTESLGYVLLEAGMASVPVLINGVGGTREAVGQEYREQVDLFRPGNPNSLAEHLQKAVKNIEHLKSAGEQLRKYVRHTYSLPRMVDETFALYES